MAKKNKASKKAAKRTASKRGVGAKRGGGTKRGASSAKGGAPGMFGVSTGPGASAQEIGRAVVASLNAGNPDAPLWKKYWSDRVESIEGVGVGMGWRGRAAMEAKCEQWMSENIVHGARAEGPFVGSTGFAVKITMDTEARATGERKTMSEVAVYRVEDGKVVREEFMYESP